MKYCALHANPFPRGFLGSRHLHCFDNSSRFPMVAYWRALCLVCFIFAIPANGDVEEIAEKVRERFGADYNDTIHRPFKQYESQDTNTEGKYNYSQYQPFQKVRNKTLFFEFITLELLMCTSTSLCKWATHIRLASRNFEKDGPQQKVSTMVCSQKLYFGLT